MSDSRLTAPKMLVVRKEEEIEDDVSSLGGVEEKNEEHNGASGMLLALRNGDTSCPSGVSAEERELWNCFQGMIDQRKATDTLQVMADVDEPMDPQLEDAHIRIQALEAELRQKASYVPPSQYEDACKQLEEKTTALESAKLLITSLEHANGSLAADLRQKLRTSQDEAVRLRTEAATRLESLDSMAVELRDVRNQQRSQRDDLLRMRKRLETNMGTIRDAAVIWEATQDTSALGQLSNVFCDCMVAIREGMEKVSVVSDVSASRAKTIASSAEDAEEIERLEAELQNAEERVHKCREDIEMGRLKYERDVSALRIEVEQLQNRCTTNMAVLARKERELVVLRDSLKVDDDDGGYISDDGTETEDETDQLVPVRNLSPIDSIDSSVYGPTQAEALATLMSHSTDGGNVQNLEGKLLRAVAENEQAKKQLKMEKESLANAKLIISSLEKANKTMMEDLRSRLHNSNTAMASLLQKSVGSEEKTRQLRSDFERLKREKDEEKERYQYEIDMLRGADLSHEQTPEPID